MKKTSAKYNARLLANLLKKHGCSRIVVAPGSRNAPLVIAFTADQDYEWYSVTDERAAAFTALGMALETQKPAAVVCTSGSAAANFLPAVTEAFYQKVPLLVLTADRPEEWIGQGIGQTIDQKDLFGNHILQEADLLREPADELARNYNQRLVNEALLTAQKGPVHINLPFNEPLYDQVELQDEQFRFFDKPAINTRLPQNELESLAAQWNRSPKVWVLAGQMVPDPVLAETLNELQKTSPFLVFSETLSNLHCQGNIASIDRLISSISPSEKEDLRPGLLITLGGEVVSKVVKKYLQKYSPVAHWHISENGRGKDTFHQLTRIIPAKAETVFAQLTERAETKDVSWRDSWLHRHRQKAAVHQEYVAKASFSDLTVFCQILETLPQNSVLHCANSASIRYSQLFDHPEERKHYANRGTSGIDGCTSTAVGHALTISQTVTLITGDVAFLYDSAAFWNDRLPKNLKVIVLNNRGGNIFRIIQGPDQTEDFERFQETHHQLNLQGVADTYGLSYISVQNPETLPETLQEFYTKEGLQILEIQTPRAESPEVLSEYFRYLREKGKPSS